jgi:hypothetical protein
MLELAKEMLNHANRIGVAVPPELVKKVQDTKKGVDDAYAAKGKKYKAFKVVVAKLKKTPDRFASMTEREMYNRELGQVIGEFDAIPFNPNIQADEGKWIVELYESDVQKKYRGDLVNTIDALVRHMEGKLIDRR